jgi:hypothetical protein
MFPPTPTWIYLILTVDKFHSLTPRDKTRRLCKVKGQSKYFECQLYYQNDLFQDKVTGFEYH